MEERTLIICALASTLIGLPILYILSLYVDPGELQLEDKLVIGTITSVRTGKATTLYVQEERLVPVVYFEPTSYKRGDTIEAKGSMHEGEFIADEISIHHPS